MAGVKGKSGLKKGRTNNPSGKPIGTKNKVSYSLKKLLADFGNDKFEQFKNDFDSIDDSYQRAKMYVEISKLLIPRPVSEEELDAIRSSKSVLLSRLFFKDADTDTDVNP
jgi:hypothetical protein